MWKKGCGGVAPQDGKSDSGIGYSAAIDTTFDAIKGGRNTAVQPTANGKNFKSFVLIAGMSRSRKWDEY